MLTSSAEESPGSLKKRWRLTAAGGDPRESATESKPPRRGNPCTVRVKGCGKSAPRGWQQPWHGKPHREQDQIGVAGQAGQPVLPSRIRISHPGWLLEGAGNGSSRRMAVAEGDLQTEPGLQAGWQIF